MDRIFVISTGNGHIPIVHSLVTSVNVRIKLLKVMLSIFVISTGNWHINNAYLLVTSVCVSTDLMQVSL